MGGAFYSHSARSARAESKGYFTKSSAELFEQEKKGRIHESMDPKTIRLRESRDSSVHPSTFPIVFGMDVTGSMRRVPHELIKDGLPKMISDIIQRGVESPALLFLALGDSQCGDNAPLQIAQFESGDAELDMWLERTWPEGGGGGNLGESYIWSWYFAGNHCETDAWDKRKQKGLLVTFGDEPFLKFISREEFEEVMGLEHEDVSAESLLEKAQERWNVYHMHLTSHRPAPSQWKQLLGDNLIEVKDFRDVPKIVADLAAKCCSYCGSSTKPEPSDTSIPPSYDEGTEGPEIIL